MRDRGEELVLRAACLLRALARFLRALQVSLALGFRSPALRDVLHQHHDVVDRSVPSGEAAQGDDRERRLAVLPHAARVPPFRRPAAREDPPQQGGECRPVVMVHEAPPRLAEQLAARVAEHPAELVVHLVAGPVGREDRRADQREVEVALQPRFALGEGRGQLELAAHVAREQRRAEHAERHHHGEVGAACVPRERIGRPGDEVERVGEQRPHAGKRLVAAPPWEDHGGGGHQARQHPHARGERGPHDHVVAVECDPHDVHEAEQDREGPRRSLADERPAECDEAYETGGKRRHPAAALGKLEHLEQSAERQAAEEDREAERRACGDATQHLLPVPVRAPVAHPEHRASGAPAYHRGRRNVQGKPRSTTHARPPSRSACYEDATAV